MYNPRWKRREPQTRKGSGPRPAHLSRQDALVAIAAKILELHPAIDGKAVAVGSFRPQATSRWPGAVELEVLPQRLQARHVQPREMRLPLLC